MPAVTDCISLDDDRPMQRTDIEVDDSDQESFHPSFDNQPSELDYWLGKKWFEWFTWQQLMSLDRAKDSIQAMDVCRSLVQSRDSVNTPCGSFCAILSCVAIHIRPL